MYSPGATYSPSVVDKNSAVTAIIIPHWLIILIYIALWSLAFAWRHRHIKRAAAERFEN